MWIFFFCTCALIKCYDTRTVQRSTVLETMLKDPVLKNCNSSLLDDSAATFIERCNIQYKFDIINVDEREQLLCLGYYDINSRLCKQNKKILPHNTVELNNLISNITAQNLSCEGNYDKLAFGNLSNIKNYATTLKTYLNDIIMCKKMCYTLRDELDDFCKILFWGNLMLSSPETQTGDTILYNTNEGLSVTLAQRLSQENLDKLSKPQNSVNSEPLIEKVNDQLINNDNSSLLGIEKDKQVSETPGEQVVKTVVVQKDKETAIIPTPHEERNKSDELPSIQEEKNILIDSDHPDQVVGGVADTQNKKKQNPEKSKKLESIENDLSQQFQDGDLEDNFDDEDPIPSKDEEGEIPRKPIEPPRLPENSNVMITQTLDGNIIQNQGNDKNFNELQNMDHRNGLCLNPCLNSTLLMIPAYITGSLPVNEVAEEGHFFPMFLTLVGLSALMYILFHNKNKILGLLVEGRVYSTRRRGTHAYSRLNTLEHAVASPAPPAHKATILY